MAKSPTQKEIELEPDAWKRFERAVDIVVKAPPQHRSKSAQKKKPARKPPPTQTAKR